MVEDIGRLLAEEAEAAEEHRDDDVPLVQSRQPAREPAQVYSLRIPAEKLAELRRLADQRHLTPSALMRSWVLERLERESSGEERLLIVVRKAVRDELVETLFLRFSCQDSASVARDRTSAASGGHGRKSGPLKSRRAGASVTKGRRSQVLVAKIRRGAASA